MSAQLVLAALFTPSQEEKWNENIDWQPIPVKKINQRSECTEMICLYAILLGSHDTTKSRQYCCCAKALRQIHGIAGKSFEGINRNTTNLYKIRLSISVFITHERFECYNNLWRVRSV